MKKPTKKESKKRKVGFTFAEEMATEVALVGDFNGWDSVKHQMTKNKNGVWEISIFLAPGTYEYKLKVDGRWQTDPANALTCQNCYGTRNSFIIISE